MDNVQNQYDEINLADYVKVILKHWKLIFLFFVLATISGFVFSFFSPKVYKIDSSLAVGRVAEELIEPAGQLVEKINSQIYFAGDEIKIKASTPANTRIVKMEIESADFQKAKNVLEEVNRFILKEHDEKIESKKILIGKDVEGLTNKIALLDKNIEKTRNKIKSIENDIFRIKNKINSANEEKKNLENKIAGLEQVLIYEQTPGTQFALFSTKERLENKKQEIEDLYLSINSLERTIEDLDIEINSLASQKNDLALEINKLNKSVAEIEATKIIKDPAVSKFPIKPRPLLNTAIAAVLGLFIGVFLGFAKEWWQKAKLSTGIF